MAVERLHRGVGHRNLSANVRVSQLRTQECLNKLHFVTIDKKTGLFILLGTHNDTMTNHYLMFYCNHNRLQTQTTLTIILPLNKVKTLRRELKLRLVHSAISYSSVCVPGS